MRKTRLFSLFVLLMMAVTGTWAVGTRGALMKGVFSVSASKKVYFSKGNLQLVGENTWKFADNQWDYFGSNQSNNHRDFFSWGTGNNPNSTTGVATFADWGDNTYLQSTLGPGWYTMSKDEWGYLFNSRLSGSTVFDFENARYTLATVNTDGTGVKGIILIPDGVKIASSEVKTAGSLNGVGTITECTTAQWAALESKGCVFLPAAGYRGEGYGAYNDYWSSTKMNDTKAYGLNFNFNYPSGGLSTEKNFGLGLGFAVRLVIGINDLAYDVTGVSLSQTQATLHAGETLTLTTTVAPANAGDKTVTWSSSNEEVATVDANGVVTAVSEGTATITATATNGSTDTSDDKTATCTVNVNYKTVVTWESGDISGSGNTISKDGVTVVCDYIDYGDKKFYNGTFTTDIGNFINIQAVTNTFPLYTDSNWSDGTWTGNANSVSFNNNTGMGPITSLTFTISHAAPIAVTELSLSQPGATLEVGKTLALTATVAPTYATDKTLTWTTSDADVATVDANGVVTAKAVGTAIITVTTNSGHKTATCTVTVRAPKGKTTVVWNQSDIPTSVTTFTKDGVTLNATIMDYSGYPAIRGKGSFTLTTPYENYVFTDIQIEQLDSYGSMGTGWSGSHWSGTPSNSVSFGTASSYLLGVTQMTFVLEEPNIPVTGITLSQTEALLKVNQTLTLTPTIAPANASDQNVTWQSSDPKVATVDANGVVKGKTEGTAIITVTTNDGQKTATCTVTVTNQSNVTWTSDDIQNNAVNKSVTIEDISLDCDNMDETECHMLNGTFTTTVGKFTKIVITAQQFQDLSGNGWTVSDDGTKATWTGNAESVSFSGIAVYVSQIEYYREMPTPSTTLAETDDNTTWLTENDGITYDVTLTRTLKTGGYNTFAVPFDISSEILTELGITAKELTSSSLSDGVLTLNFANASSIEAGKPYLVKVTSEVANPTFEGVTIDCSTTTAETTTVDFVPVINKTSLTGGDKTVLFVSGGNKLTYPSADGNIQGFRAYFKLKDGAAEARTFNLNIDGNTTGVIELKNGKMEEWKSFDSWYTLDGKKLQGKPTQKGVYIVNGKKIIIK